MTNSISGSATVAVPPVVFPLNLHPVGAQRIEKAVAKSAKEQHRAKVRKIRHDTELEAAEYAQILQRKLIARALEPNVDLDALARITWKLQDRGIGRVREAESDDDPKAKGASVEDFLDVLTAISASSRAIESAGKAAPQLGVERDVTPSSDDAIDLSQFLEGDDDD